MYMKEDHKRRMHTHMHKKKNAHDSAVTYGSS